MKKYFDEKFLKFVMVGILNTIVGYTLNLIGLNILGFGFFASSLLNVIPTSVMSFFLNKYFTFKAKGNLKKEAIRFALNIMICHVLAYGIAKPVTKWVMGHMGQWVFDFIENVTFGILSGHDSVIDNVATLVGMALFVAFNYTGQRFFAFKDEE